MSVVLLPLSLQIHRADMLRSAKCSGDIGWLDIAGSIVDGQVLQTNCTATYSVSVKTAAGPCWESADHLRQVIVQLTEVGEMVFAQESYRPFHTCCACCLPLSRDLEKPKSRSLIWSNGCVRSTRTASEWVLMLRCTSWTFWCSPCTLCNTHSAIRTAKLLSTD